MLPEATCFEALEVEVCTDGMLFFRPKVLKLAVMANGDEPSRVLADEDLMMHYIAQWYLAHRQQGGQPDEAMERIARGMDAKELQGPH